MSNGLKTQNATPPLDLSNCEREPIHIPGAIQPHGALLAVRELDWTIIQASTNVETLFGIAHAELLGQSLDVLLSEEARARLQNEMSGQVLDGNPLYTFTPQINGAPFNAIAHRRNSVLILELESSPVHTDISFANLYPVMRDSIAELQYAVDFESLCQTCAAHVRHLTGFDKVMVYQFDHEWTGTVVAEDKVVGMDEYLGLRFPASDIPAQARQLYLLNRLRLIADVDYVPVPILPVLTPSQDTSKSDTPLDLSFSTLRSVSPIHIEYLRNMKVGASMSISVVRDGQLWGLIACHHATSHRVPYEVRTACEFLGQVFALQLSAREQADNYTRRLHLKTMQEKLLAAMTRPDNWITGLADCETDLLEFADARGAALIYADDCLLMGKTPTKNEVRDLALWLRQKWNNKTQEKSDAVFYTQNLSSQFAAATEWTQTASGLLAVEISEVHQSAILWFRPEVIQSVKWSGNPQKPAEIQADGSMSLHPRKSFSMWKETVRAQSAAWQANEIEATAELRNNIIGIVLNRAERLAQLSEKLQQTNSELASFSYSVSHDLRAPFRHITGFVELLEKRIGSTLDETSLRYLHTIRDSAIYAGTLVDNLLSFSHMGRNEMRQTRVDMQALVRDTINAMTEEVGERAVKWKIEKLPQVHGDLEMLRLVIRNLLSNSVKYSRPRDEARIVIEYRDEGRDHVFSISDNGVGFDMRYASKLFGVFQRLHSSEDFEGTGIGLANVQRIIARHGGRVWAQSELGKGSTFYFSLPKIAVLMRDANAPRDDIT